MSTSAFSRRALIVNGLRVAASTTLGLPALEAISQQYGRVNRIDGVGPIQLLQNFERQFRVPASSVAVTKHGRFVFDHSGGMADPQQVTQAQQNSLFRIADLSKPITAVGIFLLIEQVKLNLTDKVFGPSGILGVKYGKPPYEQYIADITVDHLLSHTAGGWAADANDPMLQHDGWDQAKLTSETIANAPLTSAPGTQFIYSNFGYCILGRIIEQVTGQSYASWAQANVLAPCGISTMQIGANSERDRAANEVVYVGQYSEQPYKINVSRMDSTQGWIASSTQLLQFLNHVGGAPGIPSILKPETVHAMTTPLSILSPGSAQSARGWMIAEDGSWWHKGSLPGSTSLMVRTPDGDCWAALLNTRTQPHDQIDGALHTMMFQLASEFSG